MYSKLAEMCREEVLEICKRMSPAERLEAFVNQSKVYAEIYWAGKAARSERRRLQEQSESTGS
jgi:hypothetical protein